MGKSVARIRSMQIGRMLGTVRATGLSDLGGPSHHNGAALESEYPQSTKSDCIDSDCYNSKSVKHEVQTAGPKVSGSERPRIGHSPAITHHVVRAVVELACPHNGIPVSPAVGSRLEVRLTRWFRRE